MKVFVSLSAKAAVPLAPALLRKSLSKKKDKSLNKKLISYKDYNNNFNKMKLIKKCKKNKVRMSISSSWNQENKKKDNNNLKYKKKEMRQYSYWKKTTRGYKQKKKITSSTTSK